MTNPRRAFGSIVPGRGDLPVEGALRELYLQLARLGAGEPPIPDPGTPLGAITREFFDSSWAEAQGLLQKTRLLRVVPETVSAPHAFRFELDCRYKRGTPSRGRVELVDGTLSGTIRYRPDLFSAAPSEPAVVVFVDSEPDLLHANFSRRYGVLCLGALPPGPILLSDLCEHVASILRYQNVAVDDPADAEAAWYFATDPQAMDGLRGVEPLY